ncbi:MAG TPA: TonB-dependent receptor, partial [Bacteroidales bacterium]|nr:TonB-dependent receptor [Bacteroidales bacterium]
MKKFYVCLTIACLVTPGLKAQSVKDTLLLDEVVVTGSRVEVARKNLPVNVSVINSDELDEIEESAVLPVVSRMTPGLFVTERGVTGFGRDGSSSAGSITIRGIGGSPNSEVLVLVDGHPQYMGIFGHPLPNSYVASDLDRVEIIRGPASILYGSNAMGGVLNFITKEEKKEGVSATARAAYGSFNTQKYMANGGYKKGKFSVFASFNHDQTDGHRENSAFNINNGYLKAGYVVNRHIDVEADFNLAKFHSVDPGSVYAEQPVIFTADMTRGKASVSVSDKYDNVEGGLMAYYNYGDHDFSDGWVSHDENLGLSFYQGISIFDGNLTTIGYDFKRYGGKGNSGMRANQWLSAGDNAVYLVSRQAIGRKLALSAGLRLENNSLFGNILVPQGGAAYHLTDYSTLKASVSRGFRNPTIMELYLFAPNPELNPEEMMDYEASYDQVLLDGRLSAELTVYLITGSNLIEVGPNPGPPPPVKRFNTGKFNHKGLEFSADYKPFPSLRINASYSYLNMDKPRLAAPEHQVFAG